MSEGRSDIHRTAEDETQGPNSWISRFGSDWSELLPAFVPEVRQTGLPSFDGQPLCGKLVSVAEGEVPKNSEK
jgi:hypothetical protein